MKNITLISIVIIVLMAGCKKDETSPPVDARDKYVGVWKGNTTLSIPALDFSETIEGTQTISLSSTNSQRILITSSGEVMYADMNGNSYVYQEYTITDAYEGETWVEQYNGTGTLNGTTLTETGTVKISYMGETYNGTWTCTMTKQ